MEQKVNLPMDAYHAIGNLMSYAMLITQDFDTDIFVNFSAHTLQLEFTVYMGGWGPDENPTEKESFYLDAHYDAKENLKILQKRLNAAAEWLDDVRDRSKPLESHGVWKSDMNPENAKVLEQLEEAFSSDDPREIETRLEKILEQFGGSMEA